MATNKRALFRAGLFAGIEDWRTDFNAAEIDERNHVRQSYQARPATFHPPLAYVGPIAERIVTHPQLLRIFTGQLVVVRGLYDNAETSEWLDRAVDSLALYVVDHPRMVSTDTFLTVIGTEDAELNLGNDTIYAAA